jgi:hypothetical protein
MMVGFWVPPVAVRDFHGRACGRGAARRCSRVGCQ